MLEEERVTWVLEKEELRELEEELPGLLDAAVEREEDWLLDAEDREDDRDDPELDALLWEEELRERELLREEPEETLRELERALERE